MDTTAIFNRQAQQGQQMLAEDQANASKYSGQYDQYSNAYNQANSAAQSAQKQYQDYNSSMLDPTALYRQALGDAQTSVGFNPGDLGNATRNLTRMQGTLNGLVGDQNMGANAQGLGATALAQQYQSNLQPLQAGLSTQTAAVGNLSNLYGQTLTQANQQAGFGFQGEQLKSQNYFQAAQNALNIATQAQESMKVAQSSMQFYSQLAQQQGGLNSTNASNYAAAQQAYAQASAAVAAASQSYAQAKLLGTQTQAQELANTQTQAAMNASAPRPQNIQPANSGINLGSVGVPSNRQVQGTKQSKGSLSSLMTPGGFNMGAGAFNLQ